jgi:hypothetical protein
MQVVNRQMRLNHAIRSFGSSSTSSTMFAITSLSFVAEFVPFRSKTSVDSFHAFAPSKSQPFPSGPSLAFWHVLRVDVHASCDA